MHLGSYFFRLTHLCSVGMCSSNNLKKLKKIIVRKLHVTIISFGRLYYDLCQNRRYIYLLYSEVHDPAITKYFVVTSIGYLNLDI